MAAGGGSGRLILRSSLPRDELTNRLRPHVAPGWAVFSARPFVGRVGRGTLWLRRRGSPLSRNSMQPYLFARLREEGGGTRLECRFTLHPVVLAFFALWMAVLVGVFTNLGLAMGGSGALGGGMALLALGMVAAAVAGIVLIGRHFARNDRAALLAFLRETVGAI
jgi:hypothetical protein